MAVSMNLGILNLRVALKRSAVAAITAAIAGGAIVAGACSKDQPKKLATPDTAVRAAGMPAPAFTPASPLDAPAYVGTRYDPMPAGISYEGGAVLMGKNGKPSSFAMTHVLTPRGAYMWLDSVLPTDGQNQIHARIVRGELKLRPARPNETLLIGSCEVKGKLDASVFAFAERQFRSKRLSKIHDAWRADPTTGRFDVVPPKDVVCEDPGA
jgi:hypothetical protein